MNGKTVVPRRQHGALYNSKHLPSHTPVIGLGCSSFSTFFIQAEEDTTATTTIQVGDTSTATNLDSIKNVTQKNVQTVIQPTHPIVKAWVETIHYAIENGITLLDTAPWYGHGTSEVVIGFAMEKYMNNNNINKIGIERKDIILNTKVGRYDGNPQDQFDFTYNTTIQSVKRSIERMKCTYIDVIQLHDPEFAPNMNILLKETIPALLYCREHGFVNAIGLTGYPLEVQYSILELVSKEEDFYKNNTTAINNTVFDQSLTYCHFNLHSQALFNKNIGSMDRVTNEMKRDIKDQNYNENDTHQSFAQYCHSNQHMPLIQAAPLSMGLLTHSSPPSWHPASDSLKSACHDASMIAKDHNVDLPTLAIMFALIHGGISCTLLGMGNKEQVDVALEVVKRVGNSKLQIQHDESDSCKIRQEIKMALKDILTNDEKKVLDILLDEINGPFAQVWANGDYEWDGMHEAEKFWSSLNGSS